jgi:hypothetical protein
MSTVNVLPTGRKVSQNDTNTVDVVEVNFEVIETTHYSNKVSLSTPLQVSVLVGQTVADIVDAYSRKYGFDLEVNVQFGDAVGPNAQAVYCIASDINGLSTVTTLEYVSTFAADAMEDVMSKVNQAHSDCMFEVERATIVTS